MTLQASGAITIAQVAAELGIGLPLSLGDSRVRSLAGVPSGNISLSNLYGKSSYVPMNISTTGGSFLVDTTGSQPKAFIEPASCSASLGTGGYTYSWAVIAVTSASFSITGSTTASTVQVYTGSSPGATIDQSCTLRCTVTDNTGHAVYSDCVVRVYGSGTYNGGS